MSDTNDTGRARLLPEQRRRLRALGWRWLGRRRARRPRPVGRRHRLDLDTEDEAALVDLEARL